MRADRHAQSLGALRHLDPYAPEAEDAQLFAAQLRSLKRLLFPFTGAGGSIGARQVARQRNHQPDGEFGDGHGVRPRRIHYHDAAAGGGFDIDVVDAHSGASDHAHLRRLLQHGCVNVDRGAHDQCIGVPQVRLRR